MGYDIVVQIHMMEKYIYLEWGYNNPCMTHDTKKKSNLQCKVIIDIFYAQTLQLCTYNFIFESQFIVFVDGVIQVWFVLPPSLFMSNYYQFSLKNNDLPRFSSQI
jgi:hypothetical protein